MEQGENTLPPPKHKESNQKMEKHKLLTGQRRMKIDKKFSQIDNEEYE
jgi:hypothetical protein